MEDKIMTFDEMRVMMAQTMEGFSRIEKQQEENARGFAELRKQQKERADEADRRSKEADARLQKLEEENKKEWKEIRKSIRETGKNIGGISDSNCKMAEQYFFNSLKKTKTLGGIHFDLLDKNLRRTSYDGENTLNGEYDIVMVNDVASCVIEVKYTVETKDVNDLVNRQVNEFKFLFPNLARPKIYLGIGGMSFNEEAEKTAKKLGIAILKLNGNAVEIQDNNLKIY